jgi:hypothetical protein
MRVRPGDHSSRFPMRTTANGKRSPASTRMSNCATLSVVVVSSGSAGVTQQAAQALTSRCSDFAAQLIVVSDVRDASFASTLERCGAELVAAPRGSTRAEMCDLGMNHASGTIVAVRDDIAVGDAHWLETYRSILPVRAPAPASAIAEAVVMDTLVAGQAAMADRPSAEPRVGVASIEMAAAV